MTVSRILPDRAADRPMRLVAVTGTGGKTTTCWLVASVLAEAGLRVGVVSDLGCVDADGGLAAPPDPGRGESWAAWIERLKRGGCTHAVVEAPPEFVAAGGLGDDACDTVVVTGWRGPAGGLVARRIASALAADGCLVAPRSRVPAGLFAAVARRRGRTCLTAGLHESCDVRARPVSRGLHGRTFLADGAGQSVPVSVDVPVASYARNALHAAAVGLVHGVPLHVAARGIEAVGSVAGRVERLDRGQDFAAFLDAPPDRPALASTLASLRRLTSGRLAVVAERRFVEALGVEAFSRPVRRTCDEAVVVPDGVLGDDPDEAALAAYARIDRLLGRLGKRDCLLVLGRAGGGRRRGSASLAALVDGWLRLANPPHDATFGARRVA